MRGESMREISVEEPLNIAILISGSGSGMEALVKHQLSHVSLHQTALVLSNKKNVKGLERADNHDIPTEVIEIDSTLIDKDEQREEHEKRILTKLEEYNIELVILSGYMRILSPFFVSKWSGRLLNIHPSLLPKYPGAHAHRDALNDGAKITGCTVHLVDEGVDSGPILSQASLEILPNDDENSLSDRVKKLEHKLYPETIDKFVKSLI